MLKNYFRINLRNLRRNKGYAIINILGLATGIAVCLLIFLVISFETSFDNFHKNSNRIYRVLTEYHHADSKEIFYGRGVPFAFPNALKNSFKQIEEIAPICADYNDQLVITNSGGESSKKFKEENGVFFTTPAFFKIFDFPLLAGSYETLNDPNNALLTKAIAEKYFGDWKDAIGKTFKLNNTYTIKVTGILANVPVQYRLSIQSCHILWNGVTHQFYTFNGLGQYHLRSFGCYILLAIQCIRIRLQQSVDCLSKKVKSPDNKDVQTIQPLDDVHYDTQAGISAANP